MELERISEKAATKMASCHVIMDEEVYLYSYGIQVLILAGLGLLEFLLIGIIFRRVIEVFLFYASFSLLRKHSNGFHAKNVISCSIVSGIVLITVILMEQITIRNIWIYGFVVIGLSVIGLLIGSINHPNLDMSREELDRAKRITRLSILFELLLILLLLLCKVKTKWIYYVSSGMVTDIIMILIAIFTRKEVNDYD